MWITRTSISLTGVHRRSVRERRVRGARVHDRECLIPLLHNRRRPPVIHLHERYNEGNRSRHHATECPVRYGSSSAVVFRSTAHGTRWPPLWLAWLSVDSPSAWRSTCAA